MVIFDTLLLHYARNWESCYLQVVLDPICGCFRGSGIILKSRNNKLKLTKKPENFLGNKFLDRLEYISLFQIITEKTPEVQKMTENGGDHVLCTTVYNNEICLVHFSQYYLV